MSAPDRFPENRRAIFFSSAPCVPRNVLYLTFSCRTEPRGALTNTRETAMTKPLKQTENTITFDERFAFDLYDAKGRQIGLRVVVRRRTFVESETGLNYQGEMAGTQHIVFAQQTRNGEEFGATQRGKAFATALEAMAYVTTVHDDRLAAYTKQFGR